MHRETSRSSQTEPTQTGAKDEDVLIGDRRKSGKRGKVEEEGKGIRSRGCEGKGSGGKAGKRPRQSTGK